MSIWYQSNQRLFREEKTALTIGQPLMALTILPQGTWLNRVTQLKKESAVALGTYALVVPESTRHYDYGIAITLSHDHPLSMPVMYGDDPKLPIGVLDRHILANGQACLGVPGDVRRRWNPEAGIMGFLDGFVAPFLVWQVYFDAHGGPPPWGQRPHHGQGILDFYAEILGIPVVDASVSQYMALLARKNAPKGHEPCPCGSGRKLRHCHAELIALTRKTLNWQFARADLETLQKFPTKPLSEA